MKKLTSMILSVVLILSIFCTLGITVSAESLDGESITEEHTSPCELKFNELSDGTLEVFGFENNTSDVDLIIPSEHNGKQITKIAKSAFKSNFNITSLTIPDTIDSIEAYAFEDCLNLNRVVMGKGITNIGLWAFKNCTGLKGVYISDLNAWLNIKFFDAEANPLYCAGNLYLNETLVTELIIPNDVTSINNSAFQKCTSIKSVIIPDGVMSIGGSAFSECKNLTGVAISKSVTNIDNFAFASCSNLKNVYYSGDKNDWGKIKFGEFNNDLSKATRHYNSYDGGTTGDYSWIIAEPTTEEPTESITKTSGAYEYIISGNTATITRYKGSSTWSTLAIPNSIDGYTVTGIGVTAFMGCKGFTSIIIPNSVTSIGYGAFCSCESIRSITIPGNVTNIGDYAFYNCRYLSKITIPDSVTSIGERVFGQCKSLSNIEVDTNNSNYSSIDGNLYNKDITKLIHCAFAKYINYDYRFNFPNGVTSIGSYAFDGCTGGLKNISIPDSVTSIDDCAFYHCESLRSITIPDSVTSIGYQTFFGCTNLESITIPDGVTSIGNSAFSGCKCITSITIPDSVQSIGDSTFSSCISITSIKIPDSVTSIGNYAFYSCTSLKSIKIPDSVTSIGNYAFYSCTSLKSIAIPDSVTSIGDGAFYDCTKLFAAVVPINYRDLNIYNIFPSSTEINYRKKVFSVNYDANGGNDAPEQLNITSDIKTTSFTVAKQIPLRTGYIFEGWSEEPNGSADYLPEKTYTISNSITLYAVWKERNTYIINYKLCGGEGEIPSQIKTEGNDLNLSSIIPTHAKYTFAYWISSDKKTTYNAGSIYKADANDTLYAVWKEVCSGCNGTRYSKITTCQKCRGDGKITYSTVCDSCNGTGKKTKTHTETCSNCEGLGAYYGYGFDFNGNFGWGILPCPYCDATGTIKDKEQVTCTKCGGDGKASSETRCTNCDGFGKIRTICDKCNGKNSIIYHYPNYETEPATTEPTETHVHDWDNGTDVLLPTCTVTGEKVYHCKNCEQTKTETLSALGHNFSDEFTIDKEATCTENGSKSRHCSRCDACTDETIIEKHGHDWNDGTVTKQPTCTTTGEKVYNCKNCEQTKTETLYALGHKLKTVGKKAATYFVKGYTGDKNCTTCGKIISKGKAIAKLKLGTPKVKITADKKKLMVKYTKVKNATGFQVKYTYKGKTKTKTYSTKKSVTKFIKKLKKGTYKVKVRALIKSKGKTAYSNWTKAKKYKVK